jgi:hypothetical protein
MIARQPYSAFAENFNDLPLPGTQVAGRLTGEATRLICPADASGRTAQLGAAQ